MIFLSKENIPHIKNFTIYGERHSGTNFLEKTIKKVFKINPVWDYGWKHFFGFTSPKKLYNAKNTLFICTSRNPYDWIMAMKKIPHHVPYKNTKNINSLILNEWFSVDSDEKEILEDRNYISNERYKNIFEMRQAKLYYNMYMLPNYVKNCFIFTYENILQNQSLIIDMISRQFRLPILEYPPPVIDKKSYHIEQSTIDIINQQLDWNIENIYGYYKNIN